MNHKVFFKEYGQARVDNRAFVYEQKVSIEDLYQAFKSRMEAERISERNKKVLSKFSALDDRKGGE